MTREAPYVAREVNTNSAERSAAHEKKNRAEREPARALHFCHFEVPCTCAYVTLLSLRGGRVTPATMR
eukprot:2632883-Pyramimonas_sp.AAC.1